MSNVRLCVRVSVCGQIIAMLFDELGTHTHTHVSADITDPHLHTFVYMIMSKCVNKFRARSRRR